VEVRLWGKGRRSGIEVDQRFAYIYTVRQTDEKIVRCRLFPTIQAANEAVTAAAEAGPSD
jgi:ketosteroid isomerase-like protein